MTNQKPLAEMIHLPVLSTASLGAKIYELSQEVRTLEKKLDLEETNPQGIMRGILSEITRDRHRFGKGKLPHTAMSGRYDFSARVLAQYGTALDTTPSFLEEERAKPLQYGIQGESYYTNTAFKRLQNHRDTFST